MIRGVIGHQPEQVGGPVPAPRVPQLAKPAGHQEAGSRDSAAERGRAEIRAKRPVGDPTGKGQAPKLRYVRRGQTASIETLSTVAAFARQKIAPVPLSSRRSGDLSFTWFKRFPAKADVVLTA